MGESREKCGMELMYYGAYKHLRESAWQCLYDFGIDRLPVDVMKMARDSGIRIVRDSDAKILNDGELGNSFYDGGTWIIVYDDSRSEAEIRYTVAHELGHIFLGHDTIHIRYRDLQGFDPKARSEEQANSFAVRILCPACVIWGLKLVSAEEIADACHVELRVAQKRAERMKILYKRNKFLTSHVEEKVYMRFANYIQDELWRAENAKEN